MEDDPFDSLWFDDDDEITHTSMEQVSCEKDCSAFLHPPSQLQSKKLSKKMAAKVLLNEESEILLARDQHVAYLYTGLANLSSGYVTLDARSFIITSFSLTPTILQYRP